MDANAGPECLPPEVAGFYDPRSCSIQYVVSDPATARCAVIDPVLDFDEKSGTTATRCADAILEYIDQRELTLDWILDTHPHADHFSAAGYLNDVTGAPTGIGERVVEVQEIARTLYHLPSSFRADGSQWDRLFADADRFDIGKLEAAVMFSPGHTRCSVTYVVGNAAFIHDTLFMPDCGSARADLPGGDAAHLWHSIQGILALPRTTRLFTGHDYRPGGRAAAWESTVADQRAHNLYAQADRARFVELRTTRDRTLPMPKLILPALQVNVRGGRLPEPEDDGRRYMKIPLNALAAPTWDEIA